MTALRDWVHLVTDVGERPLHRKRQATAEECVELARELDIVGCESLGVEYEIRPLGRDRFAFSGTLEADVTQACVVSLEPLPVHIKEAFAIDLGAPEALEENQPATAEREVLTIPDVEPVEGGRIEVGTMIFGVLSAGLDPYPRKPDVAFDWVDPKSAEGAGEESPFAALSKLKPKP